jgi:hypothetical protein
MGHKVLLVAYGGGHITMVGPVLRELEKSGVECVLLAGTTGYSKARQMGLAPLGYRDFTHLIDNLDEVMAWGERLAPGNSHPEVDPLESRLYLGVNYTEWIASYGQEEAARRYAEHGRRGFLPRRFLARVLADVAPDCVVATNSPRTEQAAIEAAVAAGVPSLAMIDLFALPYDPFVQRKIHARKVAVISAFARSNAIAAGIPAESVVVTGNPAFDSLASPLSIAQAAAFRRSQGWEGKQVAMLCGQLEELPGTPARWAGPLLVLEAEKLLREWVAQDAGRALVVRYHPNEFQSFPEQEPQERVHMSHPVREPLHPVLLASDAVIVQTSTVGLEAAISGRKLLSLSYSPAVTPERWDYGALGLGIAVQQPQDLVAQLGEALRSPGGVGDDYSVGRAAANVAREVMKLAGHSPHSQ